MSKSVNEKMSEERWERGETMKTHEDLGIWKEWLDTLSLNNSSTHLLKVNETLVERPPGAC
jgi:hypothetical protein